MKIMVIGGGGREHAIIKKLKESDKISKIYALCVALICNRRCNLPLLLHHGNPKSLEWLSQHILGFGFEGV